MEINYRTEPKHFANRTFMPIAVLDEVGTLANGDRSLDGTVLLKLAMLCEQVVLSEGLIVVDENMHFNEEHLVEEGDSELHEALARNQIVSNPAGLIEEEVLLTIGEPGRRVHLVHGSHIFIEGAAEEADQPDEQWYLEKDWTERVSELFSPEYISLLRRYGELRPSPITVELAVPWMTLAACHGIPYCSDAFYTARELGRDVPTNIGADLYRRLESLNSSYFEKIRRYLGPTYVRLPSLLGVLLGQCRSRNDIPRALVRLRDRFSDLRKRCTRLEIDLRDAETFRDQISIVREIESAYATVAAKVERPKRRVLNATYDIVKKVSPLQIGLAALDAARDYDVERQSLLKLPGLYDLWDASVEVKQGLGDLKRLFGREVTPGVVQTVTEICEQLTRHHGARGSTGQG